MWTGAVGCTHSMKIENVDDYRLAATAPRRLNLQLIDGSASADGKQLYDAVYAALRSHSQVDNVYILGQEPPEPPDARVTLRPTAVYDGSWWNYLITIPGFLIFTHAWNGLVYSADVATALEIQLSDNTDPILSEITTAYDLRHCDFGRGAAISSGWYIPAWGATNLLVGFFMVEYDTDATPEFLKEVRDPYGSYIANTIVQAVAEPAKQR